MEGIIKKLKNLSHDELLQLQAGVERAIVEKKNDEVNKRIKIGSVYIEKYGERYGKQGYQIFKIVRTGDPGGYLIVDRFIIDPDSEECDCEECDLNCDITYDPGYAMLQDYLVRDIVNGRYEPVDSSLYTKVDTIYSDYKRDQYKLDKEYFNKFISII